MSDDKLYSKKEISSLLKQATELQKKESGPDEDGLTLKEIEEIAKESGIDPVYIREALSQQQQGITSESKFHILGGPTSLQVGREVPHTLSAGDWELVVQEARRTFNKSGGTVQKLGNSHEWMSPPSKFIQSSLTATPKKDTTRFFVSTNFGKVAFFAYYFGFVLLTMALGIFLGNAGLSLLTGLSVMLAGAVTVFTGIRFLFGKWVDHQKNKLEDMISRFEQLIRSDDDSERESSGMNSKNSVNESAQINIPEEKEPENPNTSAQRIKTRN